MKFIRVKIKEHNEVSYADVDKAFKFSISLTKDNLFTVRAYYLTAQNINAKNQVYPTYVKLREFNKEIDAVNFVEKLLGSFLEKEK